MDLFDRLLDGSLMPHGQCLLWRNDLLFLHVGGDLLTVIAYSVIPLVLIYLVRNRTDLAFNWIFILFAAFIFLCGITHFIAMINIWNGYYFIEGVVKITTGVVSILTAILAWRLIPQALSLPSNEQLRIKNDELLQAQLQLLESNQSLEDRVKRRTRELEKMALTDSLTGILNRGGLLGQMSMEIDRAVRYKHNLSVLMVDLDHFKLINDQHGHPVGDKVLSESVNILNGLCRRSDCIGRYGGEEFLILLPETTASEASELAERIRETFEKHVFVENINLNLSLTCSIGVTQYNTDQDESGLLQVVDRMLYKAKNTGRNRVVIADSDEMV